MNTTTNKINFSIKKSINIPILFFLMLMISKEIFSYEGEKIVIFCIISFIVLSYFNFKENLSNFFAEKNEKLFEEFNSLYELNVKYLVSLRKFWKIFLDVEDQLIEIFFWIKFNIKKILNIKNKNRNHFIFYLIKDQLNFLLKDQLTINYLLKKQLIKNSFNYILLNLKNKVENENLYLKNFNYSYFLNKLNSNLTTNIFLIILNKLNLNIHSEFKTENTWFHLPTYFYTKFLSK